MKIHAHILSSNIFRHSLLFYVNPYTKRDWTSIVATWSMINDCLEQLETILVNKKGKILQDALWFHIQDLVKKPIALWLKKVKITQLNEATFPPKSGGPGACCCCCCCCCKEIAQKFLWHQKTKVVQTCLQRN